jgi:site-specific DNA-adenine methylase
MNKVKPVIGRVGGKARLAPWILQFIKQHQFSIYCEPFCGSSATYFALLNEGIPEQIKARGRHFRAVLNDADREIMNLYKTVRDYPELLAYAIYFTPYSRAEHKDSQQRGTGDRLEDARLQLIDFWQSFNGGGSEKRKAMGRSYEMWKTQDGNEGTHVWDLLPYRILSAAPHLGESEAINPYACLNDAGRAFVEPDVDIRVEWVRRYLVANCQSVGKSEICTSGGKSGWGQIRKTEGTEAGIGCTSLFFNSLPSRILTASPHLQQDLDALKKVYLECDDAIKCIERWATPETLFYADPPYVDCEKYYKHNADSGSAYNLEMHYRLAECLNAVECAGAIVSYYPNELLDELYPEEHWERHYKETVASSAGITRLSKSKKRPKRTELLLVRKNRNNTVRVAMGGQLGLF